MMASPFVAKAFHKACTIDKPSNDPKIKGRIGGLLLSMLFREQFLYDVPIIDAAEFPYLTNREKCTSS